MQVDLQTETIDMIMHDMLIQDYKILKSAILKHKENKNPAPCQIEDLKDDKRYLKALKTMLEYYLGWNWEEIVNVTED